MTHEERRAIIALSGCRFLPGSFAKKFSRSLAGLDPSVELSPRRREVLLQQLHHFRRQLPRDVVEWAEAERTGQQMLKPQGDAMTEAEWLASNDPQRMLAFLTGYGQGSVRVETASARPSERKLRLFVVAALRHVCNRNGEASVHQRAALLELERFADDGDELGLFEAWQDANLPRPGIALGTVSGCRIHASMVAEYPMADQRLHSSAILRDIVGNPFRHEKPKYQQRDVILNEWLTPRVLNIARAAYEERDWERLPILADALEDAGCDNEELLRHLRGYERCHHSLLQTELSGAWPNSRMWLTCADCRGTGWRLISSQHVRGCWALDLILGKK